MIFLKSEPVRQIFKLNLSASFLMKLSSRFDNLLWCCRFHFPFCEYSISSLPFLHFSSFLSYTFCFYDIESSSKQKLYSTAMAIPAAVNKPNFKVIKTHTHTHTHIYTHTYTHTLPHGMTQSQTHTHTYTQTHTHTHTRAYRLHFKIISY